MKMIFWVLWDCKKCNECTVHLSYRVVAVVLETGWVRYDRNWMKGKLWIILHGIYN